MIVIGSNFEHFNELENNICGREFMWRIWTYLSADVTVFRIHLQTSEASDFFRWRLLPFTSNRCLQIFDVYFMRRQPPSDLSHAHNKKARRLEAGYHITLRCSVLTSACSDRLCHRGTTVLLYNSNIKKRSKVSQVFQFCPTSLQPEQLF